MKILLIQLLVLFCCVSSLYASTKLKHRATSSQASFIDPNKLYYIRSLRENKYLEVFSGRTRVGIWDLTGSQSQKWKFDFSSGSYYQIRSAQNTNTVITCENMSSCDVIPPASSSYKQKWVIEEYTGPETNPTGRGKMIVLKSLDFGTYVGAYALSPGVEVNLWTANTGINNSRYSYSQIWVLEEASATSLIDRATSLIDQSKLYFIRSLRSGRYLDWYSQQLIVGIWDWTGCQNQQWKFDFSSGSYYQIRSAQDTNNLLTCQSSCNVVASTGKWKWVVEEYTGPERNPYGGSGKMVVFKSLDLSTYVGVGGVNNGVQANLWTANTGISGSRFSSDQIWILEEVSSSVPSIPKQPFTVSYLRADRSVRLRNLNSGRYLEWFSGQKKVGQWDWNGRANQEWLFRWTSNGYRMQSGADLSYNTNHNLKCNSGGCVMATSGYGGFQVIDYTGPETDPAGGRRLVIRSVDSEQFLGVGGTANGIQANLWIANNGINGSKFSRAQIWVIG